MFSVVFHFFNVVPMIASLLKIGDYKLNTNNGKNAGQEVMHFHYHIISNDNDFSLNCFIALRVRSL